MRASFKRAGSDWSQEFAVLTEEVVMRVSRLVGLALVIVGLVILWTPLGALGSIARSVCASILILSGVLMDWFGGRRKRQR